MKLLFFAPLCVCLLFPMFGWSANLKNYNLKIMLFGKAINSRGEPLEGLALGFCANVAGNNHDGTPFNIKLCELPTTGTEADGSFFFLDTNHDKKIVGPNFKITDVSNIQIFYSSFDPIPATLNPKFVHDPKYIDPKGSEIINFRRVSKRFENIPDSRQIVLEVQLKPVTFDYAYTPTFKIKTQTKMLELISNPKLKITALVQFLKRESGRISQDKCWELASAFNEPGLHHFVHFSCWVHSLSPQNTTDNYGFLNSKAVNFILGSLNSIDNIPLKSQLLNFLATNTAFFSHMYREDCLKIADEEPSNYVSNKDTANPIDNMDSYYARCLSQTAQSERITAEPIAGFRTLRAQVEAILLGSQKTSAVSQ